MLSGFSMGLSPAGALANLYLARMDEFIVESTPRIKFYCRFQDDIFSCDGFARQLYPRSEQLALQAFAHARRLESISRFYGSAGC